MILEGNIFDPCRFNQKTLLPANLLQRILRCPLKRRIGFRHKGGRTDGYLAAPFACNLFKLPLYLFRQLGNGQHVLICLTGEADHEIQFNFFPAVGKGRAHRMQQVFFRNALVDYVTHPLAARLRRKRQAALPHRLHLFGHVNTERVNAQAGQRYTDLPVLKVCNHSI